MNLFKRIDISTACRRFKTVSYSKGKLIVQNSFGYQECDLSLVYDYIMNPPNYLEIKFDRGYGNAVFINERFVTVSDFLNAAVPLIKAIGLEVRIPPLPVLDEKYYPAMMDSLMHQLKKMGIDASYDGTIIRWDSFKVDFYFIDEYFWNKDSIDLCCEKSLNGIWDNGKSRNMVKFRGSFEDIYKLYFHFEPLIRCAAKYKDERVKIEVSRKEEEIQELKDRISQLESNMNQTIQERLEEEKKKLLYDLMRDEEINHDRGFHSEYVRKMEEQEEMDKYFEYERKDFDLSKREQEIMMQLREKDLDILQKTIEVAQIVVESKHDKRMAEIAMQMIKVREEGITNRQQLLDIENKLLEVRNFEYQQKVLDLMNDVKLKNIKVEQARLNVGKKEDGLRKEIQEWEDKKEERRVHYEELHRDLRETNIAYWDKVSELDQLKREIITRETTTYP